MKNIEEVMFHLLSGFERSQEAVLPGICVGMLLGWKAVKYFIFTKDKITYLG